MVQGLRYKLRMMVVPIDGPTSMFCDNQFVTKNASVPEYTLSKKRNAVSYHKCVKALLLAGFKLDGLDQRIFWRIYSRKY